jgi:Fe-S cluster assembly protein SufD
VKGLNSSIQRYKSILADQSNSIFRGRVRIEQDAQKANSEQLNNSLMLSREANVSSIPQLEIYADDVKAGHGSTVGQLNKEEMFYFLSRGVDQVTATKMLAYGFVMEMASVFENSQLKEKVSNVLNEKLNGMLK